MATFEWKKLSTTDKVISVTAAVALISLFLPWYGASGVYGGASVSGFSTSYGWLGGLLIVAAGVYLVFLRAGSNMPKFSYGPGVIVLGLSLIGFVIVIIRWITLPKGSFDGGAFSYGPQVGMYLCLIAGVVQSFFALRMFRASGEALPWSK
ncbi:MAG TPA: hypothetical protein VK704_02680 [Acidimicrobiales bacterium]|jgi:hypothetical protein|nr:hypothetical protein [Acidimicrobiales bacterium]